METDYRKLCKELFGTDDEEQLRHIAEAFRKKNARNAGRKKKFSEEDVKRAAGSWCWPAEDRGGIWNLPPGRRKISVESAGKGEYHTTDVYVSPTSLHGDRCGFPEPEDQHSEQDG